MNKSDNPAAARSVLMAGVCLAALAVGSCDKYDFRSGGGLNTSSGFSVPSETIGNAEETIARRAARDGIAALRTGDYEEASRQFNLALKLEITRSEYQFMNGLAYHMLAVKGDDTRYALAEEGYKLALKFDPTNWTAEYFLGLAYLDQRKYAAAEDALLRAATVRPDDPDVLYDLARAAYYAGDPRTAAAALRGIQEVAPERGSSSRMLRALTITNAALDQRDAARNYFAAYEANEKNPNLVRGLGNRLNAWLIAHEEAVQTVAAPVGNVELAQFPQSFQRAPTTTPTPSFPPAQQQPGVPGQPGFPQQPGFPGQPGLPGALPGPLGPFDKNMVVVDVVLIGIEEDRRESRGVNVLNGLQLQFGDPLTPTPGFSWIKNAGKNLIDASAGVDTRTITRSISIPSVTYSLNIANSLSSQSEILARPSLVALAGQTSEFFSGVDISAAAVSGGQGDSVSIQKEVGVKLRVTPAFMPEDMIRLHVIAERTFLTDPSRSVLFQFRLDTTKTIVNSTVAMKFGETLILGGLSERENSGSSDGVPYLKDVPLLNLFMSRDVTRRFERSILILLTPRRPQYGARGAEDAKADEERMTNFERSLEKFERRQQKWFLPRSTFNDVIERLNQGQFNNEFRTGDIESESWHRRNDVKEKVGEVLNRVFQG